MPLRNIKYDKSSMLQRDLPNANFICTDGDGLKFAPSAGDNKVTGLAQNTHHPQESNSILWNSVKLDWTRQAVGYNFLDPNQANACEDGTTNGFGPNGSVSPTLSVSTTEYYEGKHSLKVVTPGIGSGEGMGTIPGKDIVTGNTYSTKARVKGSGTIVIALSERDSNDVSIGETTSSAITLTSSWQEISVSRVCSTGTKVRMKVYTNSVQATIFYVDTSQINLDGPASWVPGTGSLKGRYNILDSNQSNACENGTTNGFWTYQSATISPDSTQYYEGSHSLKVVTSNLVSDEGAGISGRRVTPGLKYSGKIRVKGSGNVHLTLHAYDINGNWIRTAADSGSITLTSSWQTIDVSNQFQQNEAIAGLLVSTWGKQSATFYVDTCQINAGDPAPWVEGPASDFKMTASLIGLTDDGEESIIGEKIINTCPTTEINEVINFDLSKSACQAQFTRESGTAAAGKIQLNLPKRYSNYESITLNRVWLDGWSKRKTSIITGSTDYTYYDFVIGPLTIPYVSGMNTDFSDLRFAIWNGTGYTLCTYGIFSKTNGSTAKVFVKIPTLTQSPATVSLYMFFGNTGATSVSNLGIIYMYDDFEDGKYTGRSSPYLNYTLNKGSAAIISSGQISGTYSLRHTGGNDTNAAPMAFAEANRTCIIDFDFKLTTQGPGTYDPWVTLFYLQYVDANNFLRLDTYWSGTNQRVRLQKRVAGTYTTVNEWNWLTTKLPAGSQNHYKIISYLPSTGTQYVTVIIDSTKVINAVNPASTLANTTKGFGCMQSAVGVWDNIKIRPYVGSFVFYNGNEPSIGSWGAELLPSVTPDSANPDDTVINFTAPYDWSANSYAYLSFKEYDSSNITTRVIPLSVQNVAQLGYNGLDAFDALRLKIESECNDDYTFKFNNFEYKYEI